MTVRLLQIVHFHDLTGMLNEIVKLTYDVLVILKTDGCS